MVMVGRGTEHHKRYFGAEMEREWFVLCQKYVTGYCTTAINRNINRNATPSPKLSSLEMNIDDIGIGIIPRRNSP